ncbi:MAG: bifunctional UDP-sugar hydrolase/5'-nucleotidase [Syntrophaceae bacterium]
MTNVNGALRSNRVLLCCIGLGMALTLWPKPVFSASITIIHTNDIHSHLQGLGPEIDYHPLIKGIDTTKGGMARIAGIIRNTRRSRPNDVLVLDSGDFTMGTLFHTLAREEAYELRIMKASGYDAVGLGSHDFDLKPDGLAHMLRAGAENGMPAVVCSNLKFTDGDKGDASLKKVVADGLIKPYIVLQKSGIKVGIFALIGRHAAEDAPFARPVKFSDPFKTAQAMVNTLRNDEKVDLVICLSHGGLNLNDPQQIKGDDVELAQRVTGIDVIIGGHTHTLIPKPLNVRGTLIVQAGAYGTHVGVMDLDVTAGHTATLERYTMATVNADIEGDAAVQIMVDQAIDQVNKLVLAEKGLNYYKVLAKSRFDLTLGAPDSNLGNIVTDAVRWSIDRAEREKNGRRTDVAFESLGVIRDDILKGMSGNLTVADCFRAVPLGIGMRDEDPGYPLVSFYLTGLEIKKTLEVLASVAPIKGSDYSIQVSGLKFRYNPHRVVFDRVMDIRIGDDERGYKDLDTNPSNRTLYKIGANIYTTSFLRLIGSYTYRILDITPKDSRGKPIADLREVIVDADKVKPGIQELKQWEGFLAYIASFKDTDGDGQGDVPIIYKYPQGRAVELSSWNPALLFKNAAKPTWIFTGVGAFVLAGVLILAL